jgi:colanic acid/amylovoran biosynthesis protein
VVGVNANFILMPNPDGQSLEELASVYHRFVEEAVKSNPAFRCVFLGHDRRGQDEFAFAGVIYRSLPPHLQAYCERQDEPCSFREMKAICASLDLVITGRMHLSIASLGGGTPVGCIVYNDKFEGLIQGHFGLQNVLVEPHEAFGYRGLSKFYSELLPRLSQMRGTIQERLPHVVALARDNFRQPPRQLPLQDAVTAKGGA